MKIVLTKDNGEQIELTEAEARRFAEELGVFITVPAAQPFWPRYPTEWPGYHPEWSPSMPRIWCASDLAAS